MDIDIDIKGSGWLIISLLIGFGLGILAGWLIF